MATAGLSFGKNGIDSLHKKMVTKSKVDAALVRDLTKAYQNVQVKRWETRGRSEDLYWSPLSEKYAAQKRVRFAGYPEGGRRVLIATGNLLRAATLQPVGPRPRGYPKVTGSRLVNENSIVFAIRGPYVKYVNDKRPIIKFSKRTKQEFLKVMKRWFYGR
jgi:hypothetical protein